MKDYNNLTENEKQYYADILNGIFKGTIGHVQAYQIRPNVAKATDFLISEILFCSQGITKLLIDMPGGSIYSIIFDIALGRYEKLKGKNVPFVTAFLLEEISYSFFSNLLSILTENLKYRPCVDKVNVNWKSQMGLLLAGFIDELP